MKKVFHIGFNRCGTQFIANLFRVNGYNAVHWAGGALAEDICYSECVGVKPLSKWSNYTLFSNLESIDNLSSPMMRGYEHYRYLDFSFPNSVFIIGNRNVDDWIHSRYKYRNGEYAEFYASHMGVKLKNLAEIWARDWESHLGQSREYFRNRREFIEIDIDKFEAADYISAFKPWFEFNEVPNLPGKKIHALRNTYRADTRKLLARETHIRLGADVVDQTARRLSSHCIPIKSLNRKTDFSLWSNLVITGTIKSGRFYDRHGNQVPLARSESGYFYFRRWHDKAIRPVGVLNDIVALDVPWVNDTEITIDMQDARLFGCRPADTAPTPVISYCRRVGANNVFLWPLPGYHSIGARNFLNHTVCDQIKFEEKIDKLAWRGNLSGHCSDTAAGVFENPTYILARKIAEQQKSTIDFSSNLQLLDKNVRYRVVNQYYGSSDCDIRLTPSPIGREALTALGKEHLLDSYKDITFFNKFKYILSMRGFDTGSNFISAVNTRSVVLKEEDGWEVFYSGLFKPWVHYIPITAGCTDISEKLNWARRNPIRCEEITRHAQSACELLKDIGIRKKFLEQTLLAYKNF